MQSRSYLFLLLVLVLGGISGFLFAIKKPSYGLDVRGGIRLTYQLDLSKLKDKSVSMTSAQARVVQVIEGRILGVAAEGTVQPKGEDQILIEIPGATNQEEAERKLGSSARIYMYHATNLSTDKVPRVYTARPSEDPNNPVVYFTKRGSTEVIKPGDPEYQKIIDSWTEILSGDDLSKADSEPGLNGNYVPTMHFSANGAEKMGKWSDTYFNTGENLAYVLDNRVLSVAPLAPDARITSDAQITGSFTPDYVRRLKELLNAGALPVDLKQLSSEKVDPTIGNHALDQIIVAGSIAFGVTVLFLIGYYAFPGIVATIALGLYVLFTLTALKWMGATFSLAGIAGFILSVGMAVDANILVFERFKEELKRGRPMHSAIELGFNRAFPAIVDSNACTILTSIVLATFGTGPVKGFATTLIVGVLISLFTAVFVTRSLLMFFIDSGFANKPSWYAVERNWFHKLEARADTEPLQIVEKAKKWFWISALTMVVTVPFFFMGGFKLNVEFQGGYEAVYATSGALQPNTVYASNLEKAGLKGSNVKFASSTTQAGAATVAYVTVPPNPDIDKLKTTEERSNFVKEKAGLAGAENRGFTSIGPTIQKETLKNAIIAVVLSAALIVVYLSFRFGFSLGGFVPGLRFGTSAILALVHDVGVVFGSSAVVGLLFGWEVSALFITSMLTVIGFSVHDTIVVFDRIRENLRRPEKGENLGFIMDRSITQTFARSINTSLTVIVTLAILIGIGTPTPDLKFFCVAMLIGILSGTYSSIYNASPILYLWDKAVTKKNPSKGLVGLALEEQAKHRLVQTAVRASAAPQVQNTETGRSYGQVRRRASSQQKGHIDIEDEP